MDRMAKSDKKRMIIMMGPPAAGKGFFLGEPPPKYGWKLPQMLVDADGKALLTDEDIPETPEQDESDNHLRAIQFEEAMAHFRDLQSAHQEGKKEFNKVLGDLWYSTKELDRVRLGDLITYDNFSDKAKSFKDFFSATNKDFYVSMRGWHNDAKEYNKVTGKAKERFKDEARHRFDSAVNKKIEKVSDFLIVDSAGEDIDAQDYKGQIDLAKQHGYEVTVIFLHPEQADTELSNLARGKVMGKRMVDQADISNWYEQNADALRDIQAAKPDNFVHYRKGPPDSDPAKAAEKRARARSLMNELAKMGEEEKGTAKKEINKILYADATYKLQRDTSYGEALSGLPKKPKVKDLADAVADMNRDAEKRAKVKSEKTEKSDKAPKSEEKETKAPASKEKSTKSRMQFLRDVGDRKVSNPNPESRKRYPQVKVRSLEWKYQKRYYDQWSKKRTKTASASAVLDRFLIRVGGKSMGFVGGWMASLAREFNSDLKVQGYKFTAKAGVGPSVLITIKGATEDATTARKVKEAAQEILDKSIKSKSQGVDGFKGTVSAYNKGADLILECTVIFP